MLAQHFVVAALIDAGEAEQVFVAADRAEEGELKHRLAGMRIRDEPSRTAAVRVAFIQSRMWLATISRPSSLPDGGIDEPRRLRRRPLDGCRCP